MGFLKMMRTRDFLLLVSVLYISGGVGICGGAEGGLSLQLENPGFEQGLPDETLGGPDAGLLGRMPFWETGGWRPQSDQVTFSIDGKTRHGGKQSARIRHHQANDTYLMQKVQVKPDAVYKISGWIRTENVSSPQGNIGANFAVYNTWTHSNDVKGTQDWQYRELWVRTRKDQNSLGILCRLGYWSSVADGTAWFDDISVEERGGALEGVAVQEVSPEVVPARKKGSSRSYWVALVVLIATIAALWWVLEYKERTLKVH